MSVDIEPSIMTDRFILPHPHYLMDLKYQSFSFIGLTQCSLSLLQHLSDVLVALNLFDMLYPSLGYEDEYNFNPKESWCFLYHFEVVLGVYALEMSHFSLESMRISFANL